jgi:hypothetical protein
MTDETYTYMGPVTAPEMTMANYLRRHWKWGQKTFGPGERTKGVIAHIRKELNEIEAEPYDLSEWIDVVILSIDGYLRHGGSQEEFMTRLFAKQQGNFDREWPDWRGRSEDEAIEHVKQERSLADV